MAWRAVRSNVARVPTAVVVLAMTVACGLLVPLGEDTNLVRGPDAGHDAPSVVPDAGVDPCGPIPTPPAATDEVSLPPLLFAAVGWSLDPVGDNPLLCGTRGFDLDGLQTRPPPRCEENRACIPLEAGPGQPQRFPCDGPGGEDNALREVLLAAKASIAGEAIRRYDFSHAIAAGLANSLIELVEYSGKSNDEHVIVHIYGAAGIEGIDGGTWDANEIPDLPAIWDGGQDFAWLVSEESVEGVAGFAQPRTQAIGYVRDHVLVVPETGPIRFPFILGGRNATTRNGVLMGRLVPPQAPSERYRLTHTRVGLRFAAQELLSILGTVSNPTKTWLKLCDPESLDVYRTVFRSQVCPNADLPAGNGPPDSGAQCGDLSGGLHAWFIESRVSRDERGRIVPTKAAAISPRPPCADDAGFEWCDDCTWPEARRCPRVDGDAGSGG